ncbi:[protein-PII] uridylyltransferase [Iamia sp.]|uniref:[protein-PII] uridylyltransferase n=1 Tax=Iamia sp. TaxID=2722710 RepID=UPI002C4FC01B|nr:[protein-PII] uridylyltransferase [Iamia sp.]HXH57410.1 [protein-PII] uridylyltransferase [Iamia sp.]
MATPTAGTTHSGARTGDPTVFDGAAVLASGVRGVALVEAWTRTVDRWVQALFARAVGTDPATSSVAPAPSGVALVAIGGYGRNQLCPGSDLDLLLLHAKAIDAKPVAEALWYPIWDAGVKLGHSVRTPREALSLAADDLDTATALLDVRLLAGDVLLADGLAREAAAQWEKRGKRWLARLADSVDARHARADEVAFLLEPDLKLGRGGLRDVHAVRWAERARQVLLDDDHASIDRAERDLLAVRAELHRATGRSSDVLTLDQQDEVAATLQVDGGADGLMALVAERGRTIAWRSDETWHRVRAMLAGPGWSMGGRPRALEPGLEHRDREVRLTAEADPGADPPIALRAAAAAARLGTRIDRGSLERLAADTAPFGDPWPEGGRQALVDLLSVGPQAIEQIEALDQLGIWMRVLPEWGPVRNRPQRNAYHRFTVDRHLLEAAAGTVAVLDTVDRPDLLVLGGLLHDIGKGRPGDHTEVGMELVRDLGPRMGLDADDTETLVDMVRHHLLLPDVATRRDLDDPATYEGVAEKVGSLRTLRLLHGLTIADSQATGPAAWGAWKAGLVATLVERAAVVLGAAPSGGAAPPFPSAEHRALLAAAQGIVRGNGDILTVVATDRPGLLRRVAGVMALHGLGVLAVEAMSSDDGWALERVTVAPPGDEPIVWSRVEADVEAALVGRLAIRARLADRLRTHRPRDRLRSARTEPPEVRIDNGTSQEATIVEVHATDGMGLLERICRAMAEMDLDVRSAKVQTLGDRVVDAFYVRGPDGSKITDETHLAEVRRALLHALDAG